MTFKVQRKEQIEKRYFIKWAILIIVLLIGSLFSIFVGVSELSPSHLFQTESIEWKVLVTTRVPRTISIVIAGATLSLSGLLMQQLTQNKFTSPSTVGTMQSARLGLILSLLFFPKASIFNRALFSFGFEPADDSIEASKHGMEISYEYLIQKNPDVIFVLDRTAAISDNTDTSIPSSSFEENPLIEETKAYKNHQIIYLTPDAWYLSNGGVQAYRQMITDVGTAFE